MSQQSKQIRTFSLKVTTTLDQNNGENNGGLSLREAIIKANADKHNDYVIQLEGGKFYNLKINGDNEDNSTTGDLDILPGGKLTITASGNKKAVISASGLAKGDRVLDFQKGSWGKLENLIIRDGKNVNSSAGISNFGTLTINDCTITGNNSKVFNGGIGNSGNLIVINSTVSYNKAGSFGGGIANYRGSAYVINTTVNNNFAGIDSVGINNNEGVLYLVNSTISANVGRDQAGGLTNYFGKATIINSTLTKNFVPKGGGGIWNSGSLILKNSIVSQNGGKVDVFGYGGSLTGNAHNLIGSFSGYRGSLGKGSDIINSNPGLGPLRNNGGDILTHALLPSSPAINRGNNSAVPRDIYDLNANNNRAEFLPLDQRGMGYRRFNGVIDIGAFEFQPLIKNYDLGGNFSVFNTNNLHI